MRIRHALLACSIGLLIAVSVLAACGTEPGAAPREAVGRVALLSTETGVTVVDAGTTRTRWSEAGAVSGLDGSAVFARGAGTLGSGPEGSELIERAADEVIVISEHADQRAKFSLEELRRRGSHQVQVTITPHAGARADAAYLTVPGYRALIAML